MESLKSPFHAHHDSNAANNENETIHRGSRRKREFIPEEKKDAIYWEKRRKNNEAAKRSREKRRINDYVLETHLAALKEENARLSTELMGIKLQFGLAHPPAYPVPQPSHLQHYVQGSTASNMHHHFHQRENYWHSRESASQGQQQPNPIFLPAYGLHAMRGFSYFNAPATTYSGLLTPLVLPQNLIPSSHSGAPLLKPTPKRVILDEEEEQKVPGVWSLSSAAQQYKITTKGERKGSLPKQDLSK